MDVLSGALSTAAARLLLDPQGGQSVLRHPLSPWVSLQIAWSKLFSDSRHSLVSTWSMFSRSAPDPRAQEKLPQPAFFYIL